MADVDTYKEQKRRARMGVAYPPDKEPKKDHFDSVEEAIKGSGTTVLSHLDSRAQRLTVEQVNEAEEERVPLALGEHRAYAGPYTALDDQRNSWTYAQGGESMTKRLIEAEEPEPEEEE